MLFFHTLEHQNAGLVDGIYIKKIKVNFVRENLKNKHCY